MGRKIICESCGTKFQEELLGDATVCPVCGENLDGDDDESGWITWYYYGFKEDEGRVKKSYTLEDKPLDLEKRGDVYYLVQEFKAPPEEVCGLEEVKRILRKYIPDAFIYPENPEVPKVCCPRCGSKEIQLVPKRFSILTGFLTNHYDRMCVRCQKKF